MSRGSITKKEAFIRKWSCWWFLDPQQEELTKAFERELEKVIFDHHLELNHRYELKLTLESPEMAANIIGVMEELRKAEKKHPDWPVNDLFLQVLIMQEEAGEVTKGVVDFHYGKGTMEEFKTELYQTAAMCLRILKNLEK